MKAFAYYFTEQNRSEREQLAAEMGEYWSNFAYTGQPGRGRSGTLPLWQPWATGNNMGNKQILDAKSDGGIHPQQGALTMKLLYDRFLADESFSTSQDKADFYRDMFHGREAWESYFLPQLEK
jgi:para-nitrobenzyl esterase